MRLHSWLGRPKRERARRRAHPRLNLEALDDRVVPAFFSPVNYAAGNVPQAIVTADFDGNGIQDLAVVSYWDNTVSVMLGNADGSYQAPLTAATNSNPRSLAVGDFDGDGKLDLGVATSYGVDVLMGDGAGGFGAPAHTGMWTDPTSIAVGDINHDGVLDLGVSSNYAYSGWYGTYYTGYVNVLMGNGDGTFSDSGSVFANYGYHTGVVLADLNGDLVDDVAAANTSYGTVTVMLNDGAGNLASTLGYYGGGGNGMAAGDVDGDLDLDLVTSSSWSGAVLLNDGLGAFTTQYYTTQTYSSDVALADFNHDGDLDIVTTAYSNDVTVVLGRGDGTFSPPIHSTAGAYPYSVATWDFNGDGWEDVVTANVDGNDVSILTNDQTWPPADAPLVTINDMSIAEGNLGTTN